jgi:benzoyl-CoA reductase/2-hydroxyglutaryl-CoA dehydratase subunit BcrC/BadD/HgdB
MPEVLMNVDGCFSLRMRAPQTGSVDIATYYMSNYTCEYCRALLERSIEGGFNFLSAVMAVDACAEMNRAMENIEVQKLLPGEGLFVTHVDVPYKVQDYGIEHYVQQLRDKVLKQLHDAFGTDVSDAALLRAVEEHNEICRLITEIGEYRKEDNPRITGYEFHVLNLVTYCCPKYLVVDKLAETLEELETRESDAKKAFRTKVVLVGSELDDPDFTKLIEESGALVVADRFCFGSLPGRQSLVLVPGEDVLTCICRQYLESSQCPRFMSHEKIEQRREAVVGYYNDFHAEGVIYEQIKFCDYWGFERPLASHILAEEYGLPVLSVDRPYMARSSGQLRTRIQAFVESLEIKKIRKAKGEAIRA